MYVSILIIEKEETLTNMFKTSTWNRVPHIPLMIR